MSATWDTKNLKATPLAADELLVIDTADSRNQKRVTISSLDAAIGHVDGPLSSLDNSVPTFDGITGKIIQDTGAMFINPANDFVGIGTPTPLAKLHAGTTISDIGSLTFTTTGAVITATSGDQDDAESNVLTLMRDGTAAVIFAGVARFDMSRWEISSVSPRTQLDIKLAHGDPNDLISVLTMQSGGNVGIGITAPTEKLDVLGNVKITGTLTAVGTDGTISTTANGEELLIDSNILNQGMLALRFRNSTGTVHLQLFHNEVVESSTLFSDAPLSIVSNNTLSVGAQNSLTFNSATGDLIFQTAAVEKMRLLNSGLFGIGTPTPGTILHSRSTGADTTALITREVTGTNGGITKSFIGNRDPNGVVTGAGGDEYIRDEAATSKRYLSREATTGTAWDEYVTNPPNLIVIKTAADFDALSGTSTITFTSSTTLVFKATINTAKNVIVDGVIVHFVTDFINDTDVNYTDTGTFITVTNNGTFRAQAGMGLFGILNGSTLMNFTSTGTLNIKDAGIGAWSNLGTFTGGTFLNSNTTYISNSAGWIITNPRNIGVNSVNLAGAQLSGAWFKVTTRASNTVRFNILVAEALTSTSAILDLDTRIGNDVTVVVQECTATIGNLFKQTQVANATINSVADSSPAAGTITAFADDVTGISTTVSSTTTYFEDEEVTITGTTSYNGTFQIFGVVAGVSFKIRTAFVADDATGSIASVRIDMTLAASHGVTAGMSIKSIDSQFYNLFYTVLALTGDVITLNDTFIATDTGAIERNVGLDETDPRINARDNGAFSDSISIASGFVNGNTALTAVAAADTYAAINVTGFKVNASTQRFRLIDPIPAVFRHIGKKPFFGSLNATMTAKKTTSQEKYQFALSINGAIPVFATAANIPLEVKTTLLTFPLQFEEVSLNENDTFQIMQAGVGHTDDFTIEDITMGVKD